MSNAKKTRYILQISPWITKSQAKRVEKKAEKFHGLHVYEMTERIPSMGLRYRVFIGEFRTREDATAFCHQFNFDL
jgi:hypothetical protein